eukprot:g11108.t1
MGCSKRSANGVHVDPSHVIAGSSSKSKDLRGGSGGAQEEAFRAAAVKRIVQEVSTYWIAQLDLDEFMFPRQASSLRELLVPHTHQAGSVDMFFVWYLIFGSSGWHAKPPMRQIEAYRRCASARNWNGKSIAQADSLLTNDMKGAIPAEEQLPGWIALGPKDLAFFFQTNQVSRRMEFSIASVRRHFPEAPFYLISDGGPSFQSLAEKFHVSLREGISGSVTHFVFHSPIFGRRCRCTWLST